MCGSLIFWGSLSRVNRSCVLGQVAGPCLAGGHLLHARGCMPEPGTPTCPRAPVSARGRWRRSGSWLAEGTEGRLASVPPQEGDDPVLCSLCSFPRLCVFPGQLGAGMGWEACCRFSGPWPLIRAGLCGRVQHWAN